MDTLLQDVRYAVRTLLRSPAFTAAAVLTLALGIGANTAVFSVINGVLLQPLPYEEGDDLVLLRQHAPLVGFDDMGVSVQELRDYRERNRTLSGLVEYHSLWFTLLHGGQPERVQSGVVSSNFFQVMGIRPLLGRVFLPGEAAEPVLVLGHEFWQRRFGGDPAVIGRAVEMNDRVHTIIGVLPAVPQYPGNNDVWMPWYACPFRATDTWQENRDWRSLTVLGRLAPDATLEQAREDVARIARAMHAEDPGAYPSEGAGFGATLSPLRDELTWRARPVFLVLLGTAGFILLIACANVTNMTLSRVAGREQEVTIRAALGASRGRLMRQLVTESTVLALAGGALAMLVVVGTVDLFAAFAGRFTPRAGEVGVDSGVLLFTLGVSVATGLAVGMVSAFLFGRNVSGSLREGGSRATTGVERQRVRSLLVTAQLALTFVLLIGAGLMMRSFIELQRVDPGFDPENVLTMQVDLDWSTYMEATNRRTFYRSLLERIDNLPGVLSSGLAGAIPLGGGLPSTAFRIEGRPVPERGTGPRTDVQNVSPGYFEALRIPLLRGRTFTSQDHDDAPDVVIINQSLARRYWGGEDPVGSRISADGERWATVVGVVGDVKQDGLHNEFRDQIYTSLDQNTPLRANLVIRTTAAPPGVAPDAAAAVHSIDPRQPVAFVRTMQEVRSESVAAPRLTTLLLGLFAGLALVISVTGIAGLIAFTVSQRTRELGIRIALGAREGSVLWMVVRQGVGLVLLGLAAGMVGALTLTRFIAGWLYVVPPNDLVTFVVVPLVLVAAAALAAYLPARRATRMDPMVALRAD